MVKRRHPITVFVIMNELNHVGISFTTMLLLLSTSCDLVIPWYIFAFHKLFDAQNFTKFYIYLMSVLGQPVIDASATPIVVEEGNSGHFMCSVTSTTVPPSHKLSMSVSWFIDGQQIVTTGRYRVVTNTLSIYSLTRDDDGFGVQCQAREEMGLTSSANLSITVNCKATGIISRAILSYSFRNTQMYYELVMTD